MHTECGIFGIYRKNYIDTEITNNVITGLEKLQHRGQESAGIACSEDGKIDIFKNTGLVKNVFKNFDKRQHPKICIGHVRYSTSGNSKSSEEDKLNEAQPLAGTCKLGKFAIAHNGNIPNFKTLRRDYDSNASSDTLFIKEFIEKTRLDTWEDITIDIMRKIKGVYCLAIMTLDKLFLIRDRYGYRPYCIAEDNDCIYISSETAALPNCTFVKDVKPGEIIAVTNNTIKSVYQFENEFKQRCIFEYIYFLRPTSISDNISVENTRKLFGKFLAEKDNLHHYSKTVVTGCPNSGILAGEGYAKEALLPYEQVIKKNMHTGRSFILPTDEERMKMCNMKYNIEDGKGRDLILVDDSIVRGNTLRILIALLRKKGYNKIHVRVASPPIRHPCYYGIDIPTREELVAHNRTVEEVRKYINSETLIYIDLDDVHMSMGQESENTCAGCFDGKYNSELYDW